jgi:hypothetical protein
VRNFTFLGFDLHLSRFDLRCEHLAAKVLRFDLHMSCFDLQCEHLVAKVLRFDLHMSCFGRGEELDIQSEQRHTSRSQEERADDAITITSSFCSLAAAWLVLHF